MVFERPHDDTDLGQLLLDGTVSVNGSWLAVTIPIDHVDLPFARSPNDFFHRLAATPLKRDASARQRRSEIFKAAEHKVHTSGAEHMGLQERLIKHKEWNHFAAGFARCRQGRLVVEPQIPSDPDDSPHQSNSCGSGFGLFSGVGSSVKAVGTLIFLVIM
jgi:hypothetical protein